MTQYDFYSRIAYHLLFGFGVLGATVFAIASIYVLYLLYPYVGPRR